MPLDAICLAAVSDELAGQISGLRIEKIQQPEQDVLLMALSGRGAQARLLISCGAGDARVHLTEHRFEAPQTPPMFCMLLRKHLTGARITALAQPPGERVLIITLDAPDAIGVISEKRLILELMGRHSNIILTDGDGVILGCRRRVDIEASERRQVLPGLYYRLPPEQCKLSPLRVSREQCAELSAHAQGQPADKWLLDTFLALSPLICREISWRAFKESDYRIGSSAEFDRLLEALFALVSDAKAGRFTPCVIMDGEGAPRDFSYTEIGQYEGAYTVSREYGFSSMLDNYYTRSSQQARQKQRAAAMTKTVKNARDRIARKLANQRVELRDTEGRERNREFGDIIMTNLHIMRKGMDKLIAQDFYSEDGAEVSIRLDPLKTPQQNAAKYYKDYTKAKNAEIFLTEQIIRGESELSYLESVLEEISRSEGESGLEDIRRELIETGYLKKQAHGKKEKRRETEPMRFTSTSGFLVRVGRNNLQNDNLTLRQAYKTDIWLHTQKIHGSHVIISADGREVDEQTILEAASLAAYYSQARASGKVAVDYCLARYVKKPAGARPGMVIYTDYKTVMVSPNAQAAKPL